MENKTVFHVISNNSTKLTFNSSKYHNDSGDYYETDALKLY